MNSLVTLKSLCHKITDGSHYSPIGINKGFPMLSVKDMNDYGFSYKDCKLISKEEYDKLVKADCKPKLNDLLIAKDGSYLKHVFVIKKEIDQAILSSIGILRPNLDKIYPDYLKYYLQTKSVKKEVAKKYVSGSALPRIILKGFEQISIIEKNIQTQKSIAKVLSDLDAKIELNNKINRELEAMAKTLYDYWFVQFDFPNEQGKPYKSSGGKMVYNAELKREIPEGWEVIKLVTNMNVQYGFPYSTKLFNNDGNGMPVIRIRDILDSTVSLFSTEKTDEKYKIEKGDLLIGMDGNFHMNFWDKEDCYLNQRCVKIKPKDEFSISTFQALFDTQPYIKAREKNVSRTTVGHLSANDINGLNVLKASDNIQLKANKIFNTTLNKILINRNENQQLTALRDWLLPMLMNGQVTSTSLSNRTEEEEKLSSSAEQSRSMAAEPQAEYKTNSNE